MSDLAMRPMTRDAGDVELFGACFAKNSTPKRRDALDWQYVANPTGRIFVDFALAEERLAAIYATLPVHFRVDQRVVLGVQSVDTITDTEFRGRGLFVKLAKTTYARAAESGAKLVYGFPNGSSAHGFFERLAWTNLDPVPFLIRPLRVAYVIERLKLGAWAKMLPDLPLHFGTGGRPRRGDVVTLRRFDDRATRLWHAFAAHARIAVERDARYLDWRLVDKPGESYTNRAVEDGGELAALASHTVKGKHGGRIGYLMEALCLPGRERELRVLINRALGDMMAERADVALAWCLPHSPTYRTFLRVGFVPFPVKYRPIELHFGARSFDPGLDITDRRSWYLSYLDSDTV